MNAIDVIVTKRQHLARLANQGGAAGELRVLAEQVGWLPRPRGKDLKVLLAALHATGVVIKASSFDAIVLPQGKIIEFTDPQILQESLAEMTFIEIKTASQKRVKADFSGFFFALTESEITASEALGSRHKVALYNKLTGDLMITSVPEIIARAKSTNWQVSIQL